MAKRVTVLGGVGSQAISTTIDLSRTSKFDEIVIADSNMEKASELASMLKDNRISLQEIDATSIESIIGAIKGCEIIVNGLPGVIAGSPVSIESNVVEAAIKSGVKFVVDINSVFEIEGEFTLEGYVKWNERLKKEGIGFPLFSGGITTCELLAIEAAKGLDRVDEIHIYWGCAVPVNHATPGLVDTVLWEDDPNIEDRVYYSNGNIVTGVESFGIAKSWNYPEPIASRCGNEAYALTHTEPITLCEIFPGAKMITSRGVLGDKECNALLRFIVNHGIYNMEPIEVGGAKVSPLEFMRNLLIRIGEIELEKVWKGEKVPDWYGEYSLEAEVIGIKDGIEVRRVYSSLAPPHPYHELLARDPIGEFGVAIGVPMSITAGMLLDGEIEMKTGLLSNVEIFTDPGRYLEELSRRGFRIEKTET